MTQRPAGSGPIATERPSAARTGARRRPWDEVPDVSAAAAIRTWTFPIAVPSANWRDGVSLAPTPTDGSEANGSHGPSLPCPSTVYDPSDPGRRGVAGHDLGERNRGRCHRRLGCR